MKNLQKIPEHIQEKFAYLVEDLRDKGAIREEWSNYSKLDNDKYHCHLSYKRVACWQWEKNSGFIEVYYAGSRENAPY